MCVCVLYVTTISHMARLFHQTEQEREAKIERVNKKMSPNLEEGLQEMVG